MTMNRVKYIELGHQSCLTHLCCRHPIIVAGENSLHVKSCMVLENRKDTPLRQEQHIFMKSLGYAVLLEEQKKYQIVKE